MTTAHVTLRREHAYRRLVTSAWHAWYARKDMGEASPLCLRALALMEQARREYDELLERQERAAS